MTQSKYWCFTLNNYTDEQQESLRRKASDDNCTYLIFGRERGEQGTPHLQGYLELNTRKRLTTVKRWLGIRSIHLEKRRGTSQEASDYCEKEGDFETFGTISVVTQGQRTDLDDAITSIREGASKRQLWENHTSAMIRYERGLIRAAEVLQDVEEHKHYELESFAFHPINFEEGYSQIIWGESGCGKTSYVKALYPTCLMVSHMDDLLSYDADRHGAILFDDMSFTHMPRTAQIHLVDQDDNRSIHCRYSIARIPANTIKFFTTNELNGAIFMDDPAINRRIKKHHIITRL